MDAITHTHKDTLITYDEGANLWRFTLRSRDRLADSLSKAKEIIDKPSKEKPFEKIKAWFIPWNDDPKRVEITSIADGRGPDAAVWITKNGARSKESVKRGLYPSNAVNDGLMNEIIKRSTEVVMIRRAIEELKNRLEPLNLDIPKD